MDKVSVVKRQFRMEEWRKRIAECQASGMAVSVMEPSSPHYFQKA